MTRATPGLGRRAAGAPAAAAITAAALSWLAMPVPAFGQAVDYQGLEALFQEPVTTSVTGKAQRASDAPANIDIITAADIARSGADNLPDILRLVPGVDVRRYGFAAAEVSIRGYTRPSNPRLLVLVDGQQVYLDDFGRTQWYALPVEIADIRQIEVIKGPSSALYGFNAVSGVINIVTRDPLRERQQTATVRGGTQEYGAVSASGTAPFGEWGAVRLSAGGFRARDFTRGSAIVASDVPPRRGSVSLDGRFRIAPGIEATLSGSVVDLRTQEPVGSPFLADSRYATSAVRAAITAESRIGLLGLNGYRNTLRYAYDTDQSRTRTSNAVTVVQANDTFKLGAAHAVRLGVEFRDNSERLPRYGSTVGYNLFAANAMWDWQVTPDVALTSAVRVDHMALRHEGFLLPAGMGRSQADYNGRRITALSYNTGLVWRATDLDTIRLSAARGLQAPSLTALGHQDAAADPRLPVRIAFVGSPNLRPSTVDQGEIGYDRSVSSLSSVVRIAAYVQRTTDIIADPFAAAPMFGRDGIVLQSANVGSSAAAGGELGIRGSEGGWRWNASYAYLSIRDSLDGKGQLPWFSFEKSSPAHVVMLGGGRSLGRFDLDAQGRWQSTFRDYAGDARTSQFIPVSVSNYLDLSARAAYRLTDGLTLALTANQFNVSRLAQSAGRPVERRLFLSATARF